MLLVRTYLAASSIEGVGLFAAEPIAKGALIWQFDPAFDHILPAQAVDIMPEILKEFVARYAYPHLEREGYIVVDVDNGRFMNHSERPNTDFTIFNKGFACEDIAVGKEMTCNYAEFDPNFCGFPVMSQQRDSKGMA